jgi:hypothetical protein
MAGCALACYERHRSVGGVVAVRTEISVRHPETTWTLVVGMIVIPIGTVMVLVGHALRFLA